MKKTKHGLLTAILIGGSITTAFAQNVILRQNKENGVYRDGEKIRVTMYLGNQPNDSVSVRVWKNFSNQIDEKVVKYPGDTVTIFNEPLNSPGSVIFEVRTGSKFASIGSIVDPQKYSPGTPCPKDLAKYWKAEKKALRNLPMKVSSIPVDSIEKGYECYNVEINCLGPKPARGYLAKPASAKPGTLPIVLNLHAAGVAGSWCLSRPELAMSYAKMGNGAICFDLNAHGMLNGQPASYYQDLENNELKGYQQFGFDGTREIYFKAMYLRLLRTLDYLTSLPEWDGKRILVVGESQGGGQALAAAGLDPRVTAAIVTVPALCDWGGAVTNRRGGWPVPNAVNIPAKVLKITPYLDVAHILKGSKATLVAEIGLIDPVCPAAGIYSAINQAKGNKILLPVPYRDHHVSQTAYTKYWEETTYKTKMDFMRDFLK